MNNTFDSLKKYDTPFIFASSQMSAMNYSCYGILKNIGERYTKCLNGKIVKFWNVYGYERDLNKSHVITDFILSAKQDGIIKMRTTGEEARQFLYADDCSECLTIVMDSFSSIDNIELDITNFEWTKIIDIANIISSNFDGCVVYRGDKEDDVQHNALREPSKEILKYWKPKTSIETGIKNIINKYNL